MAVVETYTEITVEQLPTWAQARKREGWQFVQLLAMQVEGGTDLLYTVRKDNQIEGGIIRGVQPDTHVPSITDWYLAAFVFENEIHDLFGVQVDGIAIDFGGNFYRVALDQPMTVISPEVQKRREKARRAAEAAAAKAAEAKKAAEEKAARAQAEEQAAQDKAEEQPKENKAEEQGVSDSAASSDVASASAEDAPAAPAEAPSQTEVDAAGNKPAAE